MSASTAWREDAACVGAPPELFYPQTAQVPSMRRVAALYCGQCPVWQACLAEQDRWEPSDRWGLWGGVWWIGGGSPYRRKVVDLLGRTRAAS